MPGLAEIFAMTPPNPIANSLLRSLPNDLLAMLQPDLERVELQFGQKLEHQHTPLEYVHFMEAGIASVIAKVGALHIAEVGIVGSEGVTGSALSMHDHIPAHETLVLVKGSSLRMPADRFQAHLEQHPPLRRTMLCFARSLWLQGSFTTVVNARSKLEVRLGRWLLMMQDRIGGKIEITHDFLALMLSVHRPGVTVAIHVLEGQRLVQSSRGCIIVSDRAGLLAFVGDAYGDAEREFQRLLGELKNEGHH